LQWRKLPKKMWKRWYCWEKMIVYNDPVNYTLPLSASGSSCNERQSLISTKNCMKNHYSLTPSTVSASYDSCIIFFLAKQRKRETTTSMLKESFGREHLSFHEKGMHQQSVIRDYRQKNHYLYLLLLPSPSNSGDSRWKKAFVLKDLRQDWLLLFGHNDSFPGENNCFVDETHEWDTIEQHVVESLIPGVTRRWSPVWMPRDSSADVIL
jgi:hypothetical protein